MFWRGRDGSSKGLVSGLVAGLDLWEDVLQEEPELPHGQEEMRQKEMCRW